MTTLRRVLSFPKQSGNLFSNRWSQQWITEGVQIRRILEHIGVDALAPPIASARGPPLWDECDAQGADCVGQGAPIDPHWGESAQAAPDDAPDQRTDW